MSTSEYPPIPRRQSLPSWRNRNAPLSPPSSKPFVSYVAPNSLPHLESSLPPDRQLREGLEDERLEILPVPLSDDLDDEDPKIENCQPIGSYNWTKHHNPTIIVPGSAPEWNNRAMPYNVKPDSGIFIIDQNTHRMPSASLLPLLVAVNQKCKNEGADPFPWGTMDLVTDRNGLRKLLRWIGGGEVKEFRIDAQLAGEKTILLNRWEKRTREELSGRTYGFNFEKASTVAAAGCEQSSGHHRIISYDFDGLKMVVRYELDACMPAPRHRFARKSESSLDALTKSLQTMNLTSTAAPFSSSNMPALTIIKGGNHVPQASTIELVTVGEGRRPHVDWKDYYPQVYLSQTVHHFMAIHRRGYFTALEKRKLSSPHLQDVHQEMIPEFKKLRKVLGMIQGLVIKHGKSGRLSFVCSGGQMSVYQRKSNASCLPEEAMSCFNVKDI
ncbi:hypothetical protein AGABI2DRAFT_193668 [Agaricus bisporus var. bisporus H97]|uniref:hypothetical protein n=1 Tax=Agaricus bisporus var. bisporus (strain H97 / ATCC MYA-4626 / FGSC 10389) TaxID=936046 RepID=UPI00029F79D7|nr:hypothetical protein AGABI2DRAFT_193668 [Agaricus bisporus var. bisporus H97]EKV45724.1 hypothetical protein AGABI2DRAFT_193668 [Agaricus bisporus var. bisporus H97]